MKEIISKYKVDTDFKNREAQERHGNHGHPKQKKTEFYNADLNRNTD